MSRLRSFICLLAALSAGVSASIGPIIHDLEIVNKQIAPDGFLRQTVLADGVFPAPVIRGKKDGFFNINVVDKLQDSSLDLATSIHWHGLFQKHTAYADGPAFVTQCPLIPNEAFQYKFAVPGQAGTFWYHSHFRNQYCDGLRGAFIVDDPDDPHKHLYDFDDDSTVITLADWYHYLSTNAPAIPLINGKGRYPGGPSVPLAVVNVKQRKRYRFRLVSISCDPSYVFSIDSHQLTVIEVDGQNVQPLLVDSLEIFAGQRYSVVLNANQKVGNYFRLNRTGIRALPQAAGRSLNFSNFNNVAILRYKGAHIENPTNDSAVNVPTSQLPLVETNLHPLDGAPVPGQPFPGGADINIQLDVALGLSASGAPQFTVNGVPFESPTVPVLLQILSGVKNASQLLPKGSIYGLAANKSVEISIPGGAPALGIRPTTFDNPVVRDVVSIGGTTADNTTIRFFTDNPGPWFLHCHIDWHLNAGFAAVFAEDVPDVESQDITTAQWRNLCPVYDKFINGTT
ncbi:laccase [Lactarius akahatsu]|uniref:laccase n=1 Tax=Lactarius akahatsu TaxID=416441 RepID=A0AAD4LJ05_9AGAM|nr:laccase [Lactarius akahatsu]